MRNSTLILRRKLSTKLKGVEEALAATETKYSTLEKTKKRIADELEDLNLDLEKVLNHTDVALQYTRPNHSTILALTQGTQQCSCPGEEAEADRQTDH